MKRLFGVALVLITSVSLTMVGTAAAQQDDDTVMEDVVEGIFDATTRKQRRYRHPHYPGDQHPERYPGYYGMYRRVPPEHAAYWDKYRRVPPARPGHHTSGHPGKRKADPDIEVEL